MITLTYAEASQLRAQLREANNLLRTVETVDPAFAHARDVLIHDFDLWQSDITKRIDRGHTPTSPSHLEKP